MASGLQPGFFSEVAAPGMAQTMMDDSCNLRFAGQSQPAKYDVFVGSRRRHIGLIGGCGVGLKGFGPICVHESSCSSVLQKMLQGLRSFSLWVLCFRVLEKMLQGFSRWVLSLWVCRARALIQTLRQGTSTAVLEI